MTRDQIAAFTKARQRQRAFGTRLAAARQRLVSIEAQARRLGFHDLLQERTR